VRRPFHTPLQQMQHLQAVMPRLLSQAKLGEALEALMIQMEQAYDEIASHYGFVCRGCEESCCRTVFYHHTYAEFMRLEAGLQSLPKTDLRQVLGRAAKAQACLDKERMDAAAGPPRAMCPLNQAGRCRLYAYRPMICRLHGIPHALRQPDGQVVNGPGCHRFEALSSEALYGGARPRSLDRTPYYQRLVHVEQQLRSHLDAPIRLNMTLTEWLAARTPIAPTPMGSPGPAPGPLRTEAREIY
jgi:Fe-S-cluster containining protein